MPGAEAGSRTLRLVLLSGFALLVLRQAWVCDDAFISFRTVWNLVHGYGLTWNTAERVQAYTHPLWLFVVAAAHALTDEIYLTVIALCTAASVAAVAVVIGRIATGWQAAVAFVAMLLSSTAIVDYTTSGLENALSYLLIAAFAALWLRSRPGQRPLLGLGLVASALVLNRLDFALLVGPALVIELRQQWGRAALRRLALAGLPVVAWELFSILFYGFPFPNTYYAKLGTGLPKADYLAQGLVYLVDVATRDPATLLLVTLPLLSPLALDVPRARLPLALGLALYLAYVVNAGGDFMQGRFLTVPAFLGAILLAADIDDRRLPLAVPAAIAAVLLGATQLIAIEPADPPIRANGVADERRYYWADTALVHHDRFRDVPSRHRWGRIGAGMRDNPRERVFVFGAIGFAGYMAGPNVHIVDPHALADAFLARIPVQGGWRPGHFHREPPPGYVESVRSGRNLLRDPAQRALYDDLQRVIRGPLFAPGRLAAIWRLNRQGPVAAADDASRAAPPR